MQKKKESIIETPEKIRFSYHIAEIGTRIAAWMMDFLIQTLVLLMIILALVFSGYSSWTQLEEGLTNLTAAFFMIMIFLVRWFYFVLFEVIMEGQSPGKKMMRIRVIRDNGDSLDFETIVLRNFLRAVDGFPVVPLIGGFVALIDSQNRRLGDIIAGTIVVNEIQYKLTIPDFQVHFTHLPEPAYGNEPDYLPVKQKLTENELYIIRRFLNEYHKLPEAKQQAIADQLANQVQKRLGLEDRITDSLQFLERIYQQHGV
ncbi:MAG TPA: RDD family protein [Bacillota bacterium]|nr:RDD family protein [Bacillota bacterium]